MPSFDYRFAALLTQKTCLGGRPRKPVSIEVPFAGRVTANVPALAFVFLAFVLAACAMQQYAHKV